MTKRSDKVFKDEENSIFVIQSFKNLNPCGLF